MTNVDADEKIELFQKGLTGLAEVFSRHRERLDRLVRFRLDPRIRSRVDSADVLQDAFIEMSNRLSDYLSTPSVSCYVWMRQRTMQVLIDIHRKHFRDKRDAQREVHFGQVRPPDATSLSMAHCLLDDMTSPSQAAVKAEEVQALREALESMHEIDREVLAMRHFEQLANSQVAEILGISSTAASNRYVRAASRLAEILTSIRPAGTQHGESP